MSKQFNEVSTRYGAPMGRWEQREVNPTPASVRLFRVRLDSGGYDDGGAYWGHGKPLFCLDQPDHETTDAFGRRGYFRAFVRADSRLSAVAEAGISRHMLKRPPLAEFRELYAKEQRGTLGAGGVILRQRLQELGF